MKKCLLFTTLLLSSFAVFSQINKGQWLAGGSGSYDIEKEKYYGAFRKQKTTELSPAGGYFFANKLAGGLKITLSGYKYSFIDDVDGEYSESNSSITFSPFLRYYILSATSKINVFTEASYDYQRDGNKVNQWEYLPLNYSGFSAAVGPSFFITPQIALELTLGYRWRMVGNPINHIQSKVGFNFHLGKSKKKE